MGKKQMPMDDDEDDIGGKDPMSGMPAPKPSGMPVQSGGGPKKMPIDKGGNTKKAAPMPTSTDDLRAIEKNLSAKKRK